MLTEGQLVVNRHTGDVGKIVEIVLDKEGNVSDILVRFNNKFGDDLEMHHHMMKSYDLIEVSEDIHVILAKMEDAVERRTFFALSWYETEILVEWLKEKFWRNGL